MKAWDIIRIVGELENEKAIRLLEDMFIYAYIKGINRGYDNALKLHKQDVVDSDIAAAKLAFKEKYL